MQDLGINQQRVAVHEERFSFRKWEKYEVQLRQELGRRSEPGSQHLDNLRYNISLEGGT
jgi:hypothetical protein